MGIGIAMKCWELLCEYASGVGEGSRDTPSHFMLQKLGYTPTGCVARPEYRLIETCRPFYNKRIMRCVCSGFSTSTGRR